MLGSSHTLVRSQAVGTVWLPTLQDEVTLFECPLAVGTDESKVLGGQLEA